MVNQKNKNSYQELEGLTLRYKNIGIVDINNLPTKQFQDLREKLRRIAFIKVAKKTVMRILFKELNAKIDKISNLNDYITGMPAIIFTNENPFKLAKIINKNKTTAPAKAGQIANKDIVIKEGPTPFAPGPIISELSSFGIKTGVDKGKVTVKKDKIVAKPGDTISAKLASLLSRLDIRPMEIGLNLKAVFENGIIIKKDILFVSEEEYFNNIKLAYSNSYNLSVGLSYPTKENIAELIGNSLRESRAVVLNRGIFTPDMISDLINLAQRTANALSEKLAN